MFIKIFIDSKGNRTGIFLTHMLELFFSLLCFKKLKFDKN